MHANSSILQAAVEYTTAAVLVAWLALTFVNSIFPHARDINPLTRWFSSTHLFPSWTFFAPNPGTFDFRLLYRECASDGVWGIWHEPEHCALQDRDLASTFWKPLKRVHKALFDLGSLLADVIVNLRSEAGAVDGAIHVSFPYIMLLRYVDILDKSAERRAIQFMVVTSEDGSPPAPFFVSSQHPVDRVDTDN